MPYKQKLSVEEKVQIVHEYLKGRIGINEAARISGVEIETGKTLIIKEGVTLFADKNGKLELVDGGTVNNYGALVL